MRWLRTSCSVGSGEDVHGQRASTATHVLHDGRVIMDVNRFDRDRWYLREQNAPQCVCNWSIDSDELKPARAVQS